MVPLFKNVIFRLIPDFGGAGQKYCWILSKHIHLSSGTCCSIAKYLNILMLNLKYLIKKMYSDCFWMFPPGASGVDVTVTGTGFDGDTKENNIVKIGNITCAVSSATDTEIVCTAGMGPAGPRTVWVSVIGKGAAKVKESRSRFERGSS